MSKRKHLIDPNYLQDMLVLWKPLKYFFLFPYLGENLRMSHLLEKRQHTLMRACGTSAKMLNQDWYWITLWCIWMQMGFVFSDPMFQSCHHVHTVPGESWAQGLAGRLLGPCAEDLHSLKHNPGLLGGNTSRISPQGGHSGALDRWLKWRKQRILVGSQKKKADGLCLRQVYGSSPLEEGNVMW